MTASIERADADVDPADALIRARYPRCHFARTGAAVEEWEWRRSDLSVPCKDRRTRLDRDAPWSWRCSASVT